jgi:hypothetical protein
MPIGYSGAPRVTQSNQSSRVRRLSRSLVTGNNGTPLRVTLIGTERIQFEAAPIAANTNARRDVIQVYSSEFQNASETAVVNAVVNIGYQNDCGLIEIRCGADNTLIWSINNTFGGGPGGVLYMGATGLMKATNTTFNWDNTNTMLSLIADSAITTPMLKLEQDGAGDATINFLLTSTAGWTTGVDNSDGDKYKITSGNTIEAANTVIVTSAPLVGIGVDPAADLHIYTNDSSTDSQVRIEQDSTGDATINFLLTSTAGWTTGVDNSDGDKYKITSGNTIEAANTVIVTSAPLVGIGVDPATDLHIYTNDSSTDSQVRIEQDSTGDVGINFLLTATAGWAIGIDNSDSDKLKISAGNTVGANTVVVTSTPALGVNISPASTIDVDGSHGFAITEVNVNTTLNSTHTTVLVNCNSVDRVITLPAAAGAIRRIYNVKKIDSSANTVTVDGDGAEKIDGANTHVISSQWNSVTIQCDGTAWFKLHTQ